MNNIIEDQGRELFVTSVFEEYRMLRAEIKQRQSNMIALITATVGANGILFKLGFDMLALKSTQHSVVFQFFLILIPSINLILLLVLLFEVAQMMQFGNYALYHEAKLKGVYESLVTKRNSRVSDHLSVTEREFKLTPSRIDLNQPLGWEQWLRAMRDPPGIWWMIRSVYSTRLAGHLASFYVFRIIIFALPALFATGIGLATLWGSMPLWKLAISVIPYVMFALPALMLALAINVSTAYSEPDCDSP